MRVLSWYVYFFFGVPQLLLELWQISYNLRHGISDATPILVAIGLVGIGLVLRFAERMEARSIAEWGEVVFVSKGGAVYRIKPNPVITRTTCLQLLHELEGDGALDRVKLVLPTGRVFNQFQRVDRAEQWFLKNLS